MDLHFEGWEAFQGQLAGQDLASKELRSLEYEWLHDLNWKTLNPAVFSFSGRVNSAQINSSHQSQFLFETTGERSSCFLPFLPSRLSRTTAPSTTSQCNDDLFWVESWVARVQQIEFAKLGPPSRRTPARDWDQGWRHQWYGVSCGVWWMYPSLWNVRWSRSRHFSGQKPTSDPDER